MALPMQSSGTHVFCVALLCLLFTQKVFAECAVGSGLYGPECLACPVCENLGTCLDGQDGNGTCACPPTTSGALCDICMPNYDPNTKCTSVLDACAMQTSDTTADDSPFAKFCRLREHGECVTNFNVVPTQSTCGCSSGFELDAETQECNDVNECKMRPSPCVDVPYSACINLVGSYNCTCRKGYEPVTVDTLFIVRSCARPVPVTPGSMYSSRMLLQDHRYHWLG